MEVKELRIGNLILDDEGYLSQIIGFSPFDHLVRCDTEEGCWIDIDIIGFLEDMECESYLCKPIPLTADWLKSFGFRPFVNDWSLNNIIIHTRKRGFVLRKKTPDIKYVHQLQNLYFALKGEELTVIK